MQSAVQFINWMCRARVLIKYGTFAIFAKCLHLCVLLRVQVIICKHNIHQGLALVENVHQHSHVNIAVIVTKTYATTQMHRHRYIHLLRC